MPRFAILLALAQLVSIAGAAGAERNIVLIVADDHGRDLGCYGSKDARTPHLDALAAEGTLFSHAFCTTASCSPSRSVILTGLHNHATGQYGLEHAKHHFRSFENLRSLPVRLSEAGYRTARIGKFHVAPARVYRFEDALDGNPRNPVDMAERCRQWIGADPDRPFFLYFATADPHRSADVAEELPHRPNRFGNQPAGDTGKQQAEIDPNKLEVPPFLPDTPTCRAELAQYLQSVSRVDQGVGRLVEVLKETGKYDSTLILYISDNGIPFPGAKTTLYEPGIRLPCIVRSPAAAERGRVCDALVSWVDIAPTILDFAGIDAGEEAVLHGKSFLPSLGGSELGGRDEVFLSHTFHEVTMYYPMRGVRERRYKLIWNLAHELPFPFASDLWDSATWQDHLGRPEDALYGARTASAFTNRPEFELYDLESDPNETINLAERADYQDRLKSMQDKIKAFQRRTGDPWILKWERE